ncbi:MAG: RdgB/HAM1 family non-canonical purine NTP pyrophosphatase [Burkholderiales bacterium]
MNRIVIASNNAGKLREFSALLQPFDFEAVPQAALGITEADEPFATFVENALAKARHASRAAGLPALADDSGICVPALGGAPGVWSARYAQNSAGEPKSDARNNEKLVREIAQHADKRAYYYCALVMVRSADDPQPLIADGEWWGEIIATPRGAGGFGYDPHFLVPAYQQTAAELPSETKNRISHRGQAMQVLKGKLANLRGVSA